MFVRETSIIGNGGWSEMTISKFTLKLQFFDQRELQQSQAALSTHSNVDPVSPSQTLPSAPCWEMCA